MTTNARPTEVDVAVASDNRNSSACDLALPNHRGHVTSQQSCDSLERSSTKTGHGAGIWPRNHLRQSPLLAFVATRIGYNRTSIKWKTLDFNPHDLIISATFLRALNDRRHSSLELAVTAGEVFVCNLHAFWMTSSLSHDYACARSVTKNTPSTDSVLAELQFL